ncbi:MAG: fimbrillin family protein [Mucinivorans sp.]
MRGNIFFTTALLTVGAIAAATVMVGCKKLNPEPSAKTMPNVQFTATIDALGIDQVGQRQGQPQGKGQVTSRITPSTTVVAGKFQEADKVGLFLYDHTTAAYSYNNELYTADAMVKFAPAAPVFYKTYYTHSLSAYFPYNAAATTPTAIPQEIKVDQTALADFMACDFLTSRTANIKPQQIKPDDPELAMTFAHQMTNIVVKIKNGDNSPLIIKPVIKIINTKTNATIDITATKAAITLTGEAKDVIMRENEANKVGQTLFYEAIVLPQALVADQVLILVTIGSGESARIFEYKPATGAAIITAGGLVQGAEHQFNLTIDGTKLHVQGGEIQPWGTGAGVSQTINANGVVTSKMYIAVTNATAEYRAITKATLTIDGLTLAAEVSYQADKLVLIYKIPDWGYYLEGITLTGAAVQPQLTSSNKIRIKGNPTNPNYATTIATIDATTGIVTPQ